MTNETTVKPEVEVCDDVQNITDDDYRYGLWVDCYIYMACDDDVGNMPDAGTPEASAYLDGYISGCSDDLRERVQRLVDWWLDRDMDQDACQEWMSDLPHGVRAHLERKGRGECHRCNNGNKAHAG